MNSLRLKTKAQRLFSLAGVKINGKNPWDIQVHNDKVYQKVLTQGSLGLGESYMDEWWDCKKLDELFYRISKTDLGSKARSVNLLFDVIKARIMNLQSKERVFEVGEKHYDAGNDLYKGMLDKRMVYTCGYWKNAKTLNEAQEAKLDLVCKKIGLKKGMKVLDIGCGPNQPVVKALG